MKVHVVRKTPRQVASSGFLRLDPTNPPEVLVVAPPGASLTDLALVLLRAEGVTLVPIEGEPND